LRAHAGLLYNLVFVGTVQTERQWMNGGTQT
jgi:hypothetical protein